MTVANSLPDYACRAVAVGVIAFIVVTAGVGVTAAEPATTSSSGSQSATPGGTATVSFTLTNDGDATSGYILDVSLPAGWTVVEQTSDGGSWQSSDYDWLWQSVESGESVTASVTVRVPRDETADSYTVEAAAKSSAGTEDTTTRSITVEEAVQTPTPTAMPTQQTPTPESPFEPPTATAAPTTPTATAPAAAETQPQTAAATTGRNRSETTTAELVVEGADGPGFGVVTTLVAVVAAVFVASNRSK